MPDETDPPRKIYGFKERAFRRDNAPVSAEPAAPSAQDLAKLAGPPVFKVGGAAPADPRPGDPNDVHAVLRQNRAAERRHGADEIEIRRVRSRRAKEFWLLLVGGNAVIIGAVALSGLNVITVVFGLAGLIVFSLGLSWVMWQVMDRY